MAGAHKQCPVCGAGRIRHVVCASFGKEFWFCPACDSTWDQEQRIASPGDWDLSAFLSMQGIHRDDFIYLDEGTEPPFTTGISHDAGQMEPTPPAEAVRAADADLKRIIGTTRLVTLACPILVLVGVPLAAVGAVLPSLLAWGFGLTFGSIYGIAWRRARIAHRLIETSEARAVWALGWERPPDGDNYALFLPGSADDPDFVVRLPVRRDLERSTPAWVYGPLEPDLLGGVALVGPDGLLATGRVVGQRSARAKWRRAGTQPSRWVRRPPEDWLPPGGH